MLTGVIHSEIGATLTNHPQLFWETDLIRNSQRIRTRVTDLLLEIPSKKQRLSYTISQRNHSPSKTSSTAKSLTISNLTCKPIFQLSSYLKKTHPSLSNRNSILASIRIWCNRCKVFHRVVCYRYIPTQESCLIRYLRAQEIRTFWEIKISTLIQNLWTLMSMKKSHPRHCSAAIANVCFVTKNSTKCKTMRMRLRCIWSWQSKISWTVSTCEIWNRLTTEVSLQLWIFHMPIRAAHRTRWSSWVKEHLIEFMENSKLLKIAHSNKQEPVAHSKDFAWIQQGSFPVWTTGMDLCSRIFTHIWEQIFSHSL